MKVRRRKRFQGLMRKSLAGLLCVVLSMTNAAPMDMQVFASELQTEQEPMHEDEQGNEDDNLNAIEVSEEADDAKTLEAETQASTRDAADTETSGASVGETETGEIETQPQSSETDAVETETQPQSKTTSPEETETQTQSRETDVEETQTGSTETEASETETQSTGTEIQTETVETETQRTENLETETQTESEETETQTQAETETEETDTEATETEIGEESIDVKDSFKADGDNDYISFKIANNKLTITVKAYGNGKRYSDGSAPWMKYLTSTTIKYVDFTKNSYSLSDISGMFSGLTQLESVDFTNFNSANLTNISNLFYNCTNLKEIKSLSNLIGAKITDTSYMFYRCRNLNSITFGSNNTGNVTNMSHMFAGCSNLNSVTFGSNTAKVADMSYMFYECTNLNNLNLSALDTVSVTNMSHMFEYCNRLKNITLGGKFNTAKVTNMSYMFSNSGLNMIDLSQLNTNSVADMSYMFSNSGLSSIKFGGNTSNVTNMSYMFSRCISLNNVDLKNLDTSNVTTMASMFSGCTMLDNIVFGGKFNNAKVTNMSSMFSGCTKLDNWDFKEFKTGSVTNMSSMFSGCTGMKELDLTPLDTGNVQLMQYMFYNCRNVAKLNLNINTNNVTNMLSMFENCYQLNDITFGEAFNSTNVLNMSRMFYDCHSLKTLDLSKFNVTNATDMSYMFYSCRGLAAIDVSTFNAVSVLNTSHMFDSCTSLKTLDLSTLNADSVKNMSYMFNECIGLEALDLTSVKNGTVSNMSHMLYNCSSLKTIDLSDFNTISATDMDYVFYGCSSLPNLDLSSFDTGKATTMTYMFSNCSSMTELILDAQKYNTGNVTNMSYMFSGCNRLAYVDTSKFDTAKVNYMQSMFSDCNSLEGLDVSSFNTANVLNMQEMFSRCSSLTSLDVSKFDTGKIKNMYGMFFLCIHLEALDLSSFNTQQVTNMHDMFYSCRGLKELNLSSFDTANVTDIWNMLSECTGLKVIYAPIHLTLALSLPKETPDDRWYRSGGESAVVASMPQNLEESIMLIKNKSFEYPCIIAQKTKTTYHRGETLSLDDLTVTYYDHSGKPTAVLPGGYETNKDEINMRKHDDIQTLVISYYDVEAEKMLTDSVDLNITGKLEVEIEGISIESAVYSGRPLAYTGTAVVKIKGTNEVVLDGDIDLMYGYSGEFADGTPYPYADNGKAPSDAGRYILTVAIADDNELYTGSSKYDFEITKKPVTITADDKIVTIGHALPESYTYKVDEEAFLPGDKLLTEPVLVCEAENTDQEYTYDIIPSGADAGRNYEIVYVNGTLTVTKRGEVTISEIIMNSGTYNAEPFSYSGQAVVKLGDVDVTQEIGALTYIYSGTLDDAAHTIYEATTEAPVNAGNYILTVSVPADCEYYMGSREYAFRIYKKPITIKAKDISITVGSTLPHYEYMEIEGLLNGKTLEKEPTFQCEVTDTLTEGSYAIIPDGADAGMNYEIQYENGILTITAQLVVEEIPRQTFTGKPIKPEVRVYADGGTTLLKPKKDYTVKYYNNINADTAVESPRPTDASSDGSGSDGFTKGMAYVVVTGKGNYAGTVYRNFYIDPRVISEDGINEETGFKLNYSEQMITNAKKAQKVFRSIKYKKAMKLNEDYSLTLTTLNAYDGSGTLLAQGERINAEKPSAVPQIPAGYYGTFQLTIEGIKNYKGTLVKTLYVTDKAHLIKNASVTLGKNLKSVAYVSGAGGVLLTPGYYDTAGKTYYSIGQDGSRSTAQKENVFTVKVGQQYLEYGAEKDFTVSYIQNDRVGTATMVLTGSGAYMGTKRVNFKITGTPFSAKTVSIENLHSEITYNGTMHEQKDIVLKDTQGNIIPKEAYQIEYKNNLKKGTATIILNANPEYGYKGSIKANYKILAANLAEYVDVRPTDAVNDSISLQVDGAYHFHGAVTHSAEGAKPSKRIKLMLGSASELPVILTEGKDYTIKYTNNSIPSSDGTPMMTITGKGNYTGTITVSFDISKAELNRNPNLTVNVSAAAFNPKKGDAYEYRSKVKVMDGKKTLRAGRDYHVKGYEHCTQKEVHDYLQAKADGAAEDILQAMRPYVVIEAEENGNYTGVIEADLTIYNTKLTAANLYVLISEDPEQITYNGAQLKPEVTVYYGDSKAVKEARKAEITSDQTLTSVEGKYKLIRLKLKDDSNNGDYILTYGENIKAGKKAGKVTIIGAGMYGGNVTVKFKIQNEDVYNSTVEPWFMERRSTITGITKPMFAQ